MYSEKFLLAYSRRVVNLHIDAISKSKSLYQLSVKVIRDGFIIAPIFVDILVYNTKCIIYHILVKRYSSKSASGIITDIN